MVEYLTRASWAVLGIEVWLPTSGGPTLPGGGVHTWDPCRREDSEDWANFVRRNNQAGTHFILHFAWGLEDGTEAEPVFNIGAVDLEEWDRLERTAAPSKQPG